MKQFQPSESLAVGFLLALTGGLLDAYSYLNRGEVFATAETGNIVLMGINLAQQNWSGALHYLLPVLAVNLVAKTVFDNPPQLITYVILPILLSFDIVVGTVLYILLHRSGRFYV